MIDVQPFRPGDEHEIALQPQQEREMESYPGDWRAMIARSAQAGPAWSARLHSGDLGIPGQLLGIAGVTLLWRTRAHAWCLVAGDIPMQVWPALHKATLSRLNQIRALGVVRTEAVAMAGFPEGGRWMRMLGFEYEGLARCYGPGLQDFERYARVRA